VVLFILFHTPKLEKKKVCLKFVVLPGMKYADQLELEGNIWSSSLEISLKPFQNDNLAKENPRKLSSIPSSVIS
jgi:hypothetical protein